MRGTCRTYVTASSYTAVMSSPPPSPLYFVSLRLSPMCPLLSSLLPFVLFVNWIYIYFFSPLFFLFDSLQSSPSFSKSFRLILLFLFLFPSSSFYFDIYTARRDSGDLSRIHGTPGPEAGRGALCPAHSNRLLLPFFFYFSLFSPLLSYSKSHFHPPWTDVDSSRFNISSYGGSILWPGEILR